MSAAVVLEGHVSGGADVWVQMRPDAVSLALQLSLSALSPCIRAAGSVHLHVIIVDRLSTRPGWATYSISAAIDRACGTAANSSPTQP